HHRQVTGAGIVQRRPRERAADAVPFERGRHLRMEEDDAVAPPLVLDQGDRAVHTRLVPLRRLVVRDLDATLRHDGPSLQSTFRAASHGPGIPGYLLPIGPPGAAC